MDLEIEKEKTRTQTKPSPAAHPVRPTLLSRSARHRAPPQPASRSPLGPARTLQRSAHPLSPADPTTHALPLALHTGRVLGLLLSNPCLLKLFYYYTP